MITVAFMGIVALFALGAVGHWWDKDWARLRLSMFGFAAWSFLLMLRIGGW